MTFCTLQSMAPTCCAELYAASKSLLQIRQTVGLPKGLNFSPCFGILRKVSFLYTVWLQLKLLLHDLIWAIRLLVACIAELPTFLRMKKDECSHGAALERIKAMSKKTVTTAMNNTTLETFWHCCCCIKVVEQACYYLFSPTLDLRAQYQVLFCGAWSHWRIFKSSE